MESILAKVKECPYTPLPEALLINYTKPREAPGEEFRTLRTRLNHLQTLQPLHTLVVTSASPGRREVLHCHQSGFDAGSTDRKKSDLG